MDAPTVKSLELVANRRNGSKTGSLLQALDATKTPMGARLLRGQLISPLSDTEQIEARLTAVGELHDNDRLLESCAKDLQRFPDVDHIASRFASLPKRFDLRELRAEVEAIRGLRQAIAQTGALLADVEPLSSELWTAHVVALKQAHEAFASLAKQIDECVVADAPAGLAGNINNGAGNQRNLQDIFCIKADVNGLLDAARCAYVCTVRDMEALVEGYRVAHGVDCELVKSSSRGYHLSVPRQREHAIPGFFVQAVRQKRVVLCTTPELASLNNRQARVEEEILKLTVLHLARIRDAVVQLLPHLVKLSDAVALVDVLAGFAALARERGYVRPQIGRTLALKQSRHPVVELRSSFTPNDVHFKLGQRLAVVTGPNCVGKSTFLCRALCRCPSPGLHAR